MERGREEGIRKIGDEEERKKEREISRTTLIDLQYEKEEAHYLQSWLHFTLPKSADTELMNTSHCETVYVSRFSMSLHLPFLYNK